MHSDSPFDRAHTIRRVLEAVDQPLGPPLIAVVGPAGIGLSTALDQITATLRARGAHVVTVQFTPGPSDLPGPFGAPRIPAATELLSRSPAVLAIDDAQWVDVETLGRLESLIRKLVGTEARCVCAIRLAVPPTAGAAAECVLSHLVHEGLAQLVNLRPLYDAELRALIADRFGARPAPPLVRHLRLLTRNRPKALDAALEAYRRSDDIRVVDRHAYLARPDIAPTLPGNHDLALEVRRLGSRTWSVAKAMAVLNPLGDAAPRLVAETIGMLELEVGDALRLLSARGILRHQSARQRWVFRLPLTEAVLTDQLGPYERRRLAQAAVTAIWSGRARCEDPDYLADQEANAGRMVGERARAELLARARAVHEAPGDHVERWLRAAADLAPDSRERANTLVEHAIACRARGNSVECLESADTLLYELADHLTAEQRQQVHLTHVAALHATGDFATTEQIARGEWWPWHGRPMEQAISRAGAYYALGQWQQVRDLLAATEADWRGCPAACREAEWLGSLAGLWLGDRAQFDRGLAELGDARGDMGHRRQQMIDYVGALLTVGEIEPALRLLAGDSRIGLLGRAEQAVLAARRGRFDEALELTRQRILHGPSYGYGPVETAMFQYAAVILLARGRVARARDLLTSAQSTQPVLSHLLPSAEAWISIALGEYERSRAMVETALSDANEAGVVVGVDELCFLAFHQAFMVADREGAASYARQAERVARQLGTPRSRMNSLIIEAVLTSDPEIGAEALKLARELGEPLRLATMIEHLVRYRAADPQLLPEAYEVLGELDALLLRSWTRTLMREHNIPIPGRQSTVVENQRLLAVLVADGLGNKQLATLLQTSEKSVEGKLTRLFSQTGYRSRVELAMATFNGRLEV